MDNFSRFFKVRSFNISISVAILLLRLIVGIAFVVHGMYKMVAPFSWMDDRGIVLPSMIQGFAAFSEFFGGILILIGFLTPLAACFIGLTMSGALWYHIFLRGDPFIHPKGKSSFELASVYLIIAVLLIIQGPGSYSLDKKLFGFKK